MIKYLGSKRRLVPVLGQICAASCDARTALDLFTGTTRVAQEFKRRGVRRHRGRHRPLRRGVRPLLRRDGSRRRRPRAARRRARPARRPRRATRLRHRDVLRAGPLLPAGQRRPHRRDPRRDRRATTRDSALEPILLTSLIEAADRVDSTTGVQMAYVKQWAPRAHNRLELRPPALLAGLRAGPCSGDALDAGGDPRLVRPRLPRPAVQPAPLLHELPRVGDAGRVGRARALRRRVQAGRRPR